MRRRCCLPETAAALKQAEEDTRGRPGATVNLAVGYGGRREIADAVRSLLAEHAERGTSLEDLVDSSRSSTSPSTSTRAGSRTPIW